MNQLELEIEQLKQDYKDLYNTPRSENPYPKSNEIFRKYINGQITYSA